MILINCFLNTHYKTKYLKQFNSKKLGEVLIPRKRVGNWIRSARNFLLNNFTERNVPYSAQIEVNLKCYANCPFCAISTLPDSYVNNEMTTEQIKFLIDQLAEIGVNALSLTGGEPTLRKDLPELVYHMGVVHDFFNGITSNGYYLPEMIPKFEGLDYILTSLDYPTAELHDNLRGIKVFDKVIKSIHLANKKDINVIISTVVMKDNLNLLENICELAENLNCVIELYPCEDIIWNISDKSYRVNGIQDRIP
ncbi:MAG: radical SAM protein, partial [Promethearchaeota archaeon]